ncbi:MAG: type I-E CRISPR-associated protein Cse1/CasA [Candidatus Sumerlaeaceae bacterium]
MTYSFNLVHDPWVNVLYANGNVRRLSLVQVFEEAEKIREIAASNPTHRLSVLRLLSIVTVWLKPQTTPVSDWESLRTHILRELPNHCMNFELFGTGSRFLQSPLDEEAKEKEDKAIGYLFPEIPTGTNIAHFLHVRDGHYGVCPACCVLGLLNLCTFSLVGGSGYTTSPSPTSIYAFPGRPGDALAERLMRGAQQIETSAHKEDRSLGQPTWVTGMSAPAGILGLMTWHTRLVWLNEPVTTHQRCIICGQKEKLIFTMHYRAAPKSDQGSAYASFRDPFALPEFALPEFAPEKEPHRLETALKGFEESQENKESEKEQEWRVCFIANQAKPLQLEEWWRSPQAIARCENAKKLPLLNSKKIIKTFNNCGTRNPKNRKLVSNLVERQTFVYRAMWAELFCAGGNLAFIKSLEKAHTKILLALFSAAGTPPAIFSRELSQNCFAKAFGERPPAWSGSLDTRNIPQEMRSFIGRLAENPGLKAGNLALLRTLATRNLSSDLQAYDLFTGLYWPIRQRSPRAPRRVDAWLVAKLYARFPWSPSTEEQDAFPAHLRQLWRLGAANEMFRRYIRRRFDALFASGHGEREANLSSIFSCLQKAFRSQPARKVAHPVLPGSRLPLDWARLLDELRDWDQVRYDWIRKIIKEDKQ